MSECDGLRAAMIDGLLGHAADGADAARVAAHVQICARCAAEQAALRETITLVRSEPRLLASQRFQKSLAARLDAVDRRDERPLGRLRRMPVALKVAAALVLFATGAAWLLFDHGSTANDNSSRVIYVPRSDGNERLTPDSNVQPGRTDWPLPPPDRTDLDPNGPSQATLDELVGAPHPAGTGRDAEAGGDGAHVDPADATHGDPNSDAERLWRQRNLTELPVAKHAANPATPVAPATATPVARALDWLVRTQRPDGSWAPGEGGEPGLDTGTTALALLAFVSEGFVGAGDEASDDARAHAASAAANHAATAAAHWLFDHQSPANGAFVGGRDDAAKIFCHAVTCLALVERHVRLLADDAHGRSPAVAREHEPLERALTRLEGDLERLRYPGADDPAVARCAGQNAAWAAVALATARNCGVDFHLKPTGDRLIEEVLMRLRNEQPELIVATSHAVDAMAERTRGPADESWRRAVEKVLKDPAGIEPSLRFLVATTLASTRRGRPDSAASYAEFEARLDRALLSLQSSEAGYFDSNRRWDFFGGGPAYETSLAVMSLSVSERVDQFAALRAKLAAPRAKGPTSPQKK